MYISLVTDALVVVRCFGITVGAAVTNATGGFNIVLTAAQAILTNLLSPVCNIQVGTPLVNCNASLPSTGILQAPLQQVGTTTVGALGVVTNLVAGAFTRVLGAL